jgi:glycerophosphoryl diester phosphodiesterase
LKLLKFIGKLVGPFALLLLGLFTLTVVVIAVRYWVWTPAPMASFYGDRAFVNQGHRGAPETAPENTLPAFAQAIQLGAHGVELDVMLSKDGEIVVIHDFTLEKTTTGSGLVKDYTLAELKQLDAGSWFGEAFIGTRIPTLQEVINDLPRTALLNIEIKSESPATDGVEQAVIKAIAQNNLFDRVLVSSFNPVSLLRVKLADKRIPVGLIYAPNLPVFLSDGWFIPILRPEALHPRFDMVDEAYMDWAGDKGYRVNVWTVNEAPEMKRLLDLGVDGIITDRPDLMLQILQERGLE